MKADALKALAEAWARTADPDDRERIGNYLAEQFGNADVETWESLVYLSDPAATMLAHMAHENLAFDGKCSPQDAMLPDARGPLSAEAKGAGS